jgi:hypothetical protein
MKSFNDFSNLSNSNGSELNSQLDNESKNDDSLMDKNEFRLGVSKRRPLRSP